MFTLKQDAFADANLNNLEEFVEWWKRFDDQTPKVYATKKPICYVDELNLDGDLTDENVRRLLRWKSTQHLTHVNTKGVPNGKVQAVLRRISTINAFRRQEIPTADFEKCTHDVFPSGPVYRAFLFHIARPAEYPVWDQHVARVHTLLTRRKEEDGDWRHYKEYCPWFDDLKRRFDVGRDSTRTNIQRAKCLDSALVVYGQFLAKYASKHSIDRSASGIVNRHSYGPTGMCDTP